MNQATQIKTLCQTDYDIEEYEPTDRQAYCEVHDRYKCKQCAMDYDIIE